LIFPFIWHNNTKFADGKQSVCVYKYTFYSSFAAHWILQPRAAAQIDHPCCAPLDNTVVSYIDQCMLHTFQHLYGT